MCSSDLWRHYLFDERFELYTDHKSLKYLFSQKELNLRQHMWMDTISTFDFEILYHPGKANLVANALSRHPMQLARLKMACAMMRENEALECIAQGDVRPSGESEGVYVGAIMVTPSLIEKVKEAQVKDPKIVKLVADLVVDSLDRKSTRLNSSHITRSRMPSSA